MARRVIFALALVAGGVYGPKVTAGIAASISDGLRIKDGTDVLDIVPLAALAAREQNFCSRESPCWMAAAGSLASGLFASVKSNAILRRYAGGKSEGSCPPADGQRTVVQHPDYSATSLVTDSLLFALWMVDPTSYFFYYIADGKVECLDPPPAHDDNRLPIESSKVAKATRAAAISRGAALTEGVKRTHLGMGWRRVGLQLTLVTRVAHRLAHEHENGWLPDAVVTPDGPAWCLAPAVRQPVRVDNPTSYLNTPTKQEEPISLMQWVMFNL